MSSFTKPLKALLIEGTREFRILEGFEFYYDFPDGTRMIFKVPEDFITDFASAPRFIWWLIDPLDPHIAKAAVIHDWLYRSGEVERVIADLMLLEGMKILGAPRWKQELVHKTVRMFGGRHYRRVRRS